jgi:hypothetical protein
VLAACGGGGSSKTSKDSGGKKQTTTTTAAPRVAPLTGLPDPSGAAAGRPVLTVKIENTPISRPQAGLDAADVVWEEVVEGGITRFAAMFQSTGADVIGPIRSVRLTDQSIVWPVGGIFAYSGGAQYAIDSIKTAPVTLVDESKARSAMFRDRSRRAPDNLFGHTDPLWAFGGQPVPPPPLFTYRTTGESPKGRPATTATIGFSAGYAVTYTWDAAGGTWKRSMSGRPFTVSSGQQVAPANVVIEVVQYQGGAGNKGAEGALTGTGRLLVLTAGQVVEGTWSRPDKAKPARLLDASGREIGLTPGRTWVELPDTSYAVTVSPAPGSTTG